MTEIWTLLLFLLGLALGSFLHVLASRYDADRFLLNHDTLGGRSRCPNCKKTLRWYELLPIASFVVQSGRCRGCGKEIGWSHVWVEVASGLIAAFVPLAAIGMGAGPTAAALWTFAFLVLLLMTLIDLRLQIIPDELVVALCAPGLAFAAWSGMWGSHLGAALGAALFFGVLIAVTRGRGMGIGDAKLVFALGLLFGWPDVLILVMLAFVIGAVVGVVLVALGAKGMKSAVPFGPFLAFSAVLVFFAGNAILESWYNLMI
jgi:prepilin signal peptidase PulO-like enzyme (type II secretory pathway)